MSWNPTLNATETGRDVRAFVKQFRPVFWRLLKPLLPWIIAGYLLDSVLSYYVEAEGSLGLGTLIGAYFLVSLAISWHRVVIDGPERAVPMNPFKPQRHELAFIGVAIGLGLLAFVAAFGIGLLSALIHPIVAIVSAFIVLVAAMYAGVRIAIYFPAKAVNRSLTLKQAYALTDGLVWKILWAPMIASWRLILGLAGYLLVFAIVIAVVAMQDPDGMLIPVMWQYVLGFAIGLPMIIYFEPLLYVLGVGCLSNYYLYAIQRQTISGRDFSADNR